MQRRTKRVRLLSTTDVEGTTHARTLTDILYITFFVKKERVFIKDEPSYISELEACSIQKGKRECQIALCCSLLPTCANACATWFCSSPDMLENHTWQSGGRLCRLLDCEDSPWTLQPWIGQILNHRTTV